MTLHATDANPHPLSESEKVALGAAMLNADTAADISKLVRIDDFAVPRHSVIWEAINDNLTAGEPIDPIAVAHRLAEGKVINKVGGAAYLHDLLAIVPTAANGTWHAKKIAAAGHRRRLATAGRRLADMAETPDVDTSKGLAELTALADVAAGEGWPEPLPLTSEADLPHFPTGMLPDWVADMVEAIAEATQTPADLAGSLALATLAASTMGKVLVSPVAGWCEQTSLYTCTALEPGNRKSSVFEAMTSPLRAAETELAEAIRPQIIEARTEAEIARRAADKALAVAGQNSTDPDAVTNATSAALDAENVTIPVEPQLLADDITPEAAKTLLAAQGGRLAIMSAEGGIFQTIAGRYSGTPDLDVFLKGHAGDTLRVTRKHAAPENIRRPALTMGLAVQPSVLRDIASIPGFADRGLLARFLFAIPTSLVGRRNPTPTPATTAVVDGYHRRVAHIATTLWHTSDDHTLRLTDEAREAVFALEAEREPKLGPGGEWEPIINWANKWTGVVLRIAGLLHIAQHVTSGWATKPIDADTVQAATAIGYYYADHTLAVTDYMGTRPETGPAHKVLKWLENKQQHQWTRRDIHRALARQITTDELSRALSTLELHGYIRITDPPYSGKGRKPSPQISVHPEVSKNHHSGG